MKAIKLKSITLQNFKGARKLHVDFGQVTNIHGDNATGKTTIFDAFTWLLFGKDSNDRTTFEIKTLDANNKPIPKLEHSVTAILNVDDYEIEVKRIFREKWVTKRGSTESEFVGHETTFFWNEVPVLAGEFANKVSGIIDEKIFKLLTNPSAFNSLKWQDRRNVLETVAGEVTDQNIAQGNEDFEQLLLKLGHDKTMDEYKKQVSASLRKAKDEIRVIPTRIDEVERGKPLDLIPLETLESKIKLLDDQLAEVEGQVENRMHAQKAILDRKSEIQEELHVLKSKANSIKHEVETRAREKRQEEDLSSRNILVQARDVEQQIEQKQLEIKSMEAKLDYELSEAKKWENKMSEARLEWEKRNADTFQMLEGDCKCPTCEREFEAEDIEAKKLQLQESFNQKKAEDLKSITTRGLQYKGFKLNHSENAGKITASIESANNDLLSLKENARKFLELAKESGHPKDSVPIESVIADLLQENQEYIQAVESIRQKEIEFDSIKGVDVGDLKERREALNNEIKSHLTEKSRWEEVKKSEARIKELMNDENSLAATIARLEFDLNTIESFCKQKNEIIESNINHLFQYVKFKMFDTQINGGETETCEALIDGVPFSDANTASKINAGVDIINVLCAHHGVNAPIFIDNRESVVNLLDSPSQVINLYVSSGDHKLKVEAEGSLKLATV